MQNAGGQSKLLRIAALTALAAVSAGCFWSQPGFDNRRTGYNPHEGSLTSANVATLTERWSAPGGVGPIVTTSGRVTVLDGAGELRSYDSADGSPVWSTPVDVGDVDGAPMLVGYRNLLIVPSIEAGDPTGCLMLFDLATGAFQYCSWFYTPAGANGPLQVEAVRDGARVALTMNYPTATGWEAAISSVNPTNHSHEWIVELGTGSSITNPIVVDGMVYAVVTDASGTRLAGWDIAYACTPDCGPPAVEHDLPPGIVSGISADPTGATVAVSTNEGLLVVDRVSGQLLWTGTYPADAGYDHRTIPTWTPAALVVPVAVAGGSTEVVAFDPGGCGSPSCAPLWSAELPGRPAGQAAAAGDVVYVAVEDAFAAYPTTCDAPCAPLYLQEDQTWLSPAIVSTGDVMHAPNGDLQVLSLP